VTTIRRTWGGRRGTWPTNVFRRAITVAGVDPVAKGTVGLVDRVAARGMDGHTGTIRAGNSATAAYKFSGYMAYRTLAMTSMVPASNNGRSDPNIALPATAGAVVAAGSVMDSLAAVSPVRR
jgi:hypothetical protein